MQHCAVHSVNNILQRKVFTNVMFDDIAKQFSPDSWVNPHKSVFGTGDYDANILLYAISVEAGLPTVWFNKKKQNLNHLKTEKLAGVIINVVTSRSFFGLFESRHWLPLVPVLTPSSQQDGSMTELWFNLDPLSNRPIKLNLVEYLDKFLKQDNEAIFIFVLLPGVKDEDIWG